MMPEINPGTGPTCRKCPDADFPADEIYSWGDGGVDTCMALIYIDPDTDGVHGQDDSGQYIITYNSDDMMYEDTIACPYRP